MSLLFPDNTVLINFAILNRFDLLKSLANGNGRWCATVADECNKSAAFPGLGALAAASGIFRTALFPDSAELQDTAVFRNSLAKPGDPPHKHLGEAETIAIMSRRREDLPGFFVTDDGDAARLAAAHDIQSATTWDLLRVAFRAGWIDDHTAWGYTQTLAAHQRGGPPGVHNNRVSFDAWIRQRG